MSDAERAARRKKRIRRIVPAGVLLLLLLAAFLYCSDYYPAADTALKALESDGVLVEQTEYGWFFDGPAADRALIFYPGGKVEETAYAPLLHKLAANGVDVCLARMPFHLAVFGMNTADGIMARYGYGSWYIGGHSLGGAIAANYAAVHDLDGVILLAAYPTRDVEEPMLMIYGTEDGVVNRERLAAARQFGTVEEVVIRGGNHAGFGDYGRQSGDGEAGIPAEEQQQAAADAVLAWISRGRLS